MSKLMQSVLWRFKWYRRRVTVRRLELVCKPRPMTQEQAAVLSRSRAAAGGRS